jgi:hypothetical protein
VSEAEAGATKQPDPMEKFRELRDAYLEIWSKNYIEAINTEGYAQASGAALDGYLNASAPFKEAAEQAMLRTLQQLNMPTSVDFAGLAGRFTNIEMQLDDMGSKLDRIEKLFTAPQSATPAKPQKETAPPVSKQARSPRAASKTASAKKAAPRVRATPKPLKTGKPLRRNTRKVTK